MDPDELVLDSPRPCACWCDCRNEVLPEEDVELCAPCGEGLHFIP